MIRALLTAVFFLLPSIALCQNFNAFASINDPVGELPPRGQSFDFVWTWRNSPPPYNGRPWQFSIANKFHGFLYYEIDSGTGSGFAQIDFRNDDRWTGRTACANVVFWGEDGRYLMTRHVGGVNPDSSNSLKVMVSEQPDFWNGIDHVTVGYGWCPTGGILAEIVEFVGNSGRAISEATPFSGRQRVWGDGGANATESAPTQVADPQYRYQIWVKQRCIWRSENGTNDATGAVDYLGQSNKSCEAALSDAYAQANANGCTPTRGQHWEPLGQEVLGTNTCFAP